MPFINKPDSSMDLTILMIPFISLFEIINVVIREAKSKGRPDPNIFFILLMLLLLILMRLKHF